MHRLLLDANLLLSNRLSASDSESSTTVTLLKASLMETSCRRTLPVFLCFQVREGRAGQGRKSLLSRDRQTVMLFPRGTVSQDSRDQCLGGTNETDLRAFRSPSKTSVSSKRSKAWSGPDCSRPHTCHFPSRRASSSLSQD